jgi:hypothetical protein
LAETGNKAKRRERERGKRKARLSRNVEMKEDVICS